MELNLNIASFRKLAISFLLLLFLSTVNRAKAQYLTLEGQTGGFLTPTAYVVESAKGQVLLAPGNRISLHRCEAGDRRFSNLQHHRGLCQPRRSSATRAVITRWATALSRRMAHSVNLWNFNGMNIFHGKVVGIRDGQFGAWTPGLAAGRRGAYWRQVCFGRDFV